MIDHNHFICHFIFGGHLLNIPKCLIFNVDQPGLEPGTSRL